MSRQNCLQRMHPIHPIRPQPHVLGHFEQFHYCMNLGAKPAELEHLMHKLVQRSHVRIFHTECTRSIPLDTKLIFWGVLDRFVTAQTSVQNGRTGAINVQVRATKSHHNFSQWMHPIHPIRPQTHVLGRFGMFHYCTNFAAKWAELEHLMHKFASNFSQRTHLIHILDPKLMF
jgi:hypothetical protein